MPRVSVLLPVRDGARTLAAALDSLAAQTEGDLEVVLVDDGSTDGSAAIARAHPLGDRLRVLAPGRVGLVAALNLGLAACRAPRVARMDADDLAHPERLARQLAFLEAHRSVAVLGAGAESVVDDGAGGLVPAAEGFRRYDAWQRRLERPEAIAREIFVESPLVHPTVVFQAGTIRALGGYRDLGWPEDYDLWLRCHRAGLGIAKLSEVLLRWRDHPGRATRTDPRYRPAALLRLKAHHLVRGPLAGDRRVAIWGAGRGGRRLARCLAAEGREVTRFVDVDPRKIDGSRVVGPEGLPALRGHLLLAAVGTRGARDRIRAAATVAGFVEGEDLLCVA